MNLHALNTNMVIQSFTTPYLRQRGASLQGHEGQAMTLKARIHIIVRTPIFKGLFGMDWEFFIITNLHINSALDHSFIKLIE